MVELTASRIPLDGLIHDFSGDLDFDACDCLVSLLINAIYMSSSIMFSRN